MVKPVASRVIPIVAAKAPARAPDGADQWRRVSTLSEPRLSEMVENYRTLGYEVQVRDVQSSAGDCNTCFDAGAKVGQVFGTLYVRRAGGVAPRDDLFD
jgi:hypothetical protein